jgi:hypothetical protein
MYHSPFSFAMTSAMELNELVNLLLSIINACILANRVVG